MPTLSRRQCLQSLAATPLAAATPTRPNVVLIFCDDLGYGDLSCYGGAIPTPNLDRLAKSGIRFTNAVSANPVCSPSRAALLTGKYPTRVGVPSVLFPTDEKGLPLEHPTLANTLKSHGYRTACVGKWHLGHKSAYLPTSRGFDSYFGIPYSNDMTPAVVLDNQQVFAPEAKQDELTAQYTNRALRFIEESASNPFFLYFPHTFPHIPLYANARFRGKSPHGIYGDVLTEIDSSVGEVLSTLKRRNLERNTLVLFSSDNGPWYQGSPGPLRGRKGSTLEGGVRVPLIASQPGTIRPATSDSLVSLMDLTPTISRWCGTQQPGPTDGVDIAPLLKSTAKSVERDLLLYFDGWNLQCARQGNYKLHLSRFNTMAYNPAPAAGRQNLPLASPELYNLARDPNESYDIAAENQPIVQSILTRLNQLLPTFPEPVQTAWANTRNRPATNPPAGALPQPKK